MADSFFFLHSHKYKKHKVVLSKVELSQAEVKLMLQGIYYARIRDSITERQTEYKKLLAKLTAVFQGRDGSK